MIEMTPERLRDLAKAELLRRDYRVLSAIEQLVAGPEWCEWRAELRRIVNAPERYSDIPAEPPFGVADLHMQIVSAQSPEPDPAPRDTELAALRERITELEDTNAALKDALADAEDRIADLDEEDAHKFPAPDERLSDWDVVGVTPALSPEEADTEVDRLIRNQSEGFDVADEISGLSQMRRDELTHAIHRKKGRMRRERMTGAAPQVAEEAALDHLVDLLARRGV